MAYELKDGDGSLFFNNRKSKENHPDYTGRVQLEGRQYRIAGWKRSTKAGGGYLSLRITEQQQPPGEIDFEKGPTSPPGEAAAKAAPSPASTDGTAKPDAELDDEIPF